MSDKAKRLKQVATELGVGINTLKDFLEGKEGFESIKPTTKVDPATYAILEKEFQSDKQAKEKSKQLNETREERKTITLEDARKKEEREDESDNLDTDELFIHNLPEKEIPKSQKPTETPVEEKPLPDSPPAVETAKEETPQKPAEAENTEEIASSKQEETTKKEEVAPSTPTSGPKILDKIDIDAIPSGRRKKPAAKEAPKKADKAAEPEAKKETPAPEKPVEAKKETAENKAPEHLETNFQKLSGVTLLGKIEINEEPKKKKPVASSSPEKQPTRKKKRKRISNENEPDNSPRKTFAKKGKVELKKELTEEEIQNQVRETLARLSGGGKSKSVKHRKAKRDQVQQLSEEAKQLQEQEEKVLKVTEFVTVNELSNLINASVNEVISACMSLGLFVSINQRLDSETIQVVAEDFGYTVQFTTEEIDETTLVQADNPDNLTERAPIVTIMGHVDHGKTSLLDKIRSSNVIAGEAGGITQHIGAYSVELADGRRIAFLDTPGHEAFTAMRARGAQVTDVVIIVVAADDKVMPQTKEAINHAQAAGVPMVFAINKIDREGANPDKIKEELSALNILVEDWGGKYQSQEISAKQGINIDELLEKVLLEAELLELKADPNKRANGTVIEASLDKGRGYVSTILVQSGTLKIGDMVLCGSHFGRVKAMFNEREQAIKEAGPSTPVILLGLSGAPNAGDRFIVLEDEKQAKDIANKRLQLQREQGVKTQKHITLDEIGRRIAIGDFQELNIIVKGDVDGSVEALTDSLLNLSTEQIQVNVIHKSVGQVSETDVLLASASSAIIIGFQVRPSATARKLAEKEDVEIRSYSIIYDAIDEIKAAMQGMLKPKMEEKITCNIEIRETFKISKVGTIAGCYVLDGKVNRNTKIRLIRDGVVIYDGNLGSLKRFKDDVKEVQAGYECGLNIQNFNDIKVGDIIEGYEEVEIEQKL